MTPRVLFIGGWGRSGSTLLERILGSMKGTVSIGEMRDVWQRGVMENRLCGCGEPFLSCRVWAAVGDDAYGGWDALDVARVNFLRQRIDRPWFVPFLMLPGLLPRRWRADVDEYTRMIALLYRAIDDVNGGGLIIESSKIPSYSLILRLAGVEQRVLHLVRDSRGVVHSWRKEVERTDASDEPDLMYRYGTLGASLRYLGYNGMTHLLRGRGLSYRRIRYEDLVADPALVLDEVAAFAGLELGCEQRAELLVRRMTLATTHTVDGNPMRLRQGITAIRVDNAWRRELPARVRLSVELLTWPLLRLYGYRARSTSGPATGRTVGAA